MKIVSKDVWNMLIETYHDNKEYTNKLLEFIEELKSYINFLEKSNENMVKMIEEANAAIFELQCMLEKTVE